MLATDGDEVDEDDDNASALSKHWAHCIVAMAQWGMVMQV